LAHILVLYAMYFRVYTIFASLKLQKTVKN